MIPTSSLLHVRVDCSQIIGIENVICKYQAIDYQSTSTIWHWNRVQSLPIDISRLDIMEEKVLIWHHPIHTLFMAISINKPKGLKVMKKDQMAQWLMGTMIDEHDG